MLPQGNTTFAGFVVARSANLLSHKEQEEQEKWEKVVFVVARRASAKSFIHKPQSAYNAQKGPKNFFVASRSKPVFWK